MESADMTVDSLTDAGNSTLDKAIHTFVYGGDEPSSETADRVSFVKSFLSDYYQMAQDLVPCNTTDKAQAQAQQPCNDTACNTCSKCNTSATPEKACTCAQNNTPSNTTANNSNSNTSVEEAPCIAEEIYEEENSGADEAERYTLIRDMKSKLTEKISKMRRGGITTETAPMSPSGRVRNPPIPSSEMPQQLSFFVKTINDALNSLGTTGLTQEELKLLLATAPLPGMCSSSARDASSLFSPSSSSPADAVGRKRSMSTGDGCVKRSPCAVELEKRRLSHSQSDRLFKYSMKKDEAGGYSFPSIQEGEERKGVEEREDATGGRPRSRSSETADGEDMSPRRNLWGIAKEKVLKKEASTRKLSSFFSKKMTSVANLLDSSEYGDSAEDAKAFFKSKSWNLSTQKGSSGCNTPRSGYSTPHGDESGPSTPREGWEDAVQLRNKLEMVEKALCEEVVARTEAEQKAMKLEEMVCQLKGELERAKSHNETVSVINKQMGVELRFLRQRNSRAVMERQQWEDALVGETQKRRDLDEQVKMLIKAFKQNNENERIANGLTHQQQEKMFFQQREEVLLDVVERLRSQLNSADSQIENARIDWQEERARYQEANDELRFQFDQLTLRRGNTTSPQSSGEIQFEEQVDEVVKKHVDRAVSSRNLLSAFNVEDLTDKSNQMEGNDDEVEESSSAAPATASPAPSVASTTPVPTPSAAPPSSLSSSSSKKKYGQRMKVFFLSKVWWPKLDFLKVGGVSRSMKTPVLLMQIAWWVAELREYLNSHQLNVRFLPHSNDFCSCEDCIQHISAKNSTKI